MQPMSPRSAGPRAAAAWALAVALAAGCAESTAPPAPPGTDPTPPALTHPDSALRSLERGIRLKSAVLYGHGIADTTVVADADFHASFDPQDSVWYEVATGWPPPPWGSAEERRFFPFLVERFPVAYDVRFTPDAARPDEVGADSAFYFRRYRIFAGAVPVAVGAADLVFRRVGADGDWKLVFWADHRDTAASVRTYGVRRLDSTAE